LLYANKQEEDIMLFKELLEYEKQGILKLFFTLDIPLDSWKYFKGFVSEEMIK